MSYLNFLSGKEIVREILRQEKCIWPNAGDLVTFGTRFTARSFADSRTVCKRFEGAGGKHPFENIAFVNKAALREKVISEIKRELFRKNLPYINLGHFPSGYRTISLFRVDCDKAGKGDFFNLVDLSEKHKFPITWFIDVKSQESYLREISAIRKDGQDVQLHCYEHETYNSYSANLKNIIKGKELLEHSGIPVVGFASPFGKWNNSLNKALEDLGMEYSSEFAAGYDDLPFSPLLVTRMSDVLQIPVHPVCIGSLRNAGFTKDEMIAYFDRTINIKYQRKSPLIFYGHPHNEIDRYPEVFSFIIDRLRSHNDVWQTTMTEYSRWWKKRVNCEYKVEFGEESISVITGNTDETISLNIEKPDSTVANIPLLAGKYSLSELNWRDTGRIDSLPSSETGKIYLKDLRIWLWDLRHR
jgi:peptidoglycan/xylan/chitin deacetylase (PgdA/CDA1 family)